MTTIYFASDHAGFELKNELVSFAQSLGYTAEDCGPTTFDKDDDYPPLIAGAARKLSSDALTGKDSRAVVIGASGQGEAIVANRFKGVRCALFYGAPAKKQTDATGKELDLLESSRVHNDANCLSLAARFLSADEAKVALQTWLSIQFPGEERHLRRVRQIDDQH